MEIVHDDNNVMIFGKMWLYILNKDNEIKYQDWGVCKINKYDEELKCILDSFNRNPKLETGEKINSLEYKFKIKDSDMYMLVHFGMCMMKESEYLNIIGERCVGNMFQRLANT